uniref:Receptor activity modifying protein 2 n=1 Tax=Anas platyrhynchos platyrhynchos TaxID=8840 RepID=A0A493SUU7_ANAPP
MGTGWATLGDRVGHPCRSHHACPRAPLQPAPGPPKKPRGAIRHAPRPRCPGDRMAAATSRGLQRGWRGAGGTRPTPVARWSTGGVLLRSALPLPSCLSPARAADGTKLGPAGATACHRLVAPVPSTATRSQPGGIPPPVTSSLPNTAPVVPVPSFPVPPRAHPADRVPSVPSAALLGRGLCHTAGKADGFGQEARTSPPMAKENSTEEVYGAMAERCWEFFVELMRNVTVPQLCDWKVISRPYSLLQECLEGSAEHLNHGYPNALAERFIFQSHHRYFHNCSVGNQVFDPPEDVLLAMVFAPICLIPFLVTVVIWRSKDGKAQP